MRWSKTKHSPSQSDARGVDDEDGCNGNGIDMEVSDAGGGDGGIDAVAVMVVVVVVVVVLSVVILEEASSGGGISSRYLKFT